MTISTISTVPMAVYAQGNGSERARLPLKESHPGGCPHKSILSASLILVAAGMDLAQGLGWNTHAVVATTRHFQFCWFLAAIVGGLLSAPLIPHLRMRSYMLCASVVLLVAGIVFISAPLDYAGIVAARYLSGLAAGWTLVAYIVHASEIAYCKQRGFGLGMGQCCLSLGMAIQIISASQWSEPLMWEFPVNRLHGIFSVILALVALGLTRYIIESPIYYIRRNQESEALACQQRLRGANVLDAGTLFTHEDNRNYVLENENRTVAECLLEGALPALKLLVYRSFVAFGFSLPLSLALRFSSHMALGTEYGWPAIIYAVLGVVFTLLSSYLQDYLGRKLIAVGSLCILAVFSIAIGGVYSSFSDLQSSHQMSITCSMLLIHQIFASFYAPSSLTYLGEAFPMRIKPYLIAGCVAMEQLIHLIVICAIDRDSLGHCIFVYAVTVGVIMLTGSVCFLGLLPETRGTTLREAQDRFRRLYDTRFY